MSNPTRSSSATPGNPSEGPSAGRRCDFCGDIVLSVRRVALDVEYDRLQKAHQEQYSCSDCFESKERERLGLARR
jgi:hypothetical protein